MLAVLVIITGTSMLPALQPGSVHGLLRTSYSALHKGLIVDYRNDFTHHPTAHRIVGGWAGKWVAKGDRNRVPDRGYVTAKNYLGQIL